MSKSIISTGFIVEGAIYLEDIRDSLEKDFDVEVVFNHDGNPYYYFKKKKVKDD